MNSIWLKVALKALLFSKGCKPLIRWSYSLIRTLSWTLRTFFNSILFWSSFYWSKRHKLNQSWWNSSSTGDWTAQQVLIERTSRTLGFPMGLLTQIFTETLQEFRRSLHFESAFRSSLSLHFEPTTFRYHRKPSATCSVHHAAEYLSLARPLYHNKPHSLQDRWI